MQVFFNLQDLVNGETSVLADFTMSEEDKLNFILAISERMEEIIQRTCPYHTGAMKKSLSVEYGEKGVKFSYSSSYAPYVHEIMYRWHKRPTRAKWLTDALTQALKEMVFEFGYENIPSFNIVFSTMPILQIQLTTENVGVNWREFV